MLVYIEIPGLAEQHYWLLIGHHRRQDAPLPAPNCAGAVVWLRSCRLEEGKQVGIMTKVGICSRIRTRNGTRGGTVLIDLWYS